MLEKVEYLRNEYGGQIYRLVFNEPPTPKQVGDAVKSVDSCPFGYGILGVSSGNCVIIIKIYND